jgi:hypothetical protein
MRRAHVAIGVILAFLAVRNIQGTAEAEIPIEVGPVTGHDRLQCLPFFVSFGGV